MGPILQNGLSFGQPQIRSLLLDSCVTLFAFDTVPATGIAAAVRPIRCLRSFAMFSSAGLWWR